MERKLTCQTDCVSVVIARHIRQVCKIPGQPVAWGNKFYTLEHNIFSIITDVLLNSKVSITSHARKAQGQKIRSFTGDYRIVGLQMKLAACHTCGAHNVEVAPKFLQICGLVLKEMKDAVQLNELIPLPPSGPLHNLGTLLQEGKRIAFSAEGAQEQAYTYGRRINFSFSRRSDF